MLVQIYHDHVQYSTMYVTEKAGIFSYMSTMAAISSGSETACLFRPSTSFTLSQHKSLITNQPLIEIVEVKSKSNSKVKISID